MHAEWDCYDRYHTWGRHLVQEEEYHSCNHKKQVAECDVDNFKSGHIYTEFPLKYVQMDMTF